MRTLQEATLDVFLPLARMQELAGSAHAKYVHARPFPHLVFDDFFDPTLLDEVLREFPQPGAIRWQRFDNEREVKLASAAEGSFGPVTRLLLYHHLRSADVLIVQRKLLPAWQLRMVRSRIRWLVYDYDDAVFLRNSYSTRGHDSAVRSRRFDAMRDSAARPAIMSVMLVALR